MKCGVKHKSQMKYTGIEGIDYLTCPICQIRTRQYTPDHAKMHGYNSIKEFAQDNSITQITCTEKKKLSSGKNNPAYNHNGKFSIWSKNYVNGYDEKRHQDHIKEHTKFVREQKHLFKNNIEYWMIQTGGDTDKAKELHRKFQTRDLDWFVDKYGEEEGAKRHKSKTEKWLNTMNNKSLEETKRINQLKAAGIGKKSQIEKDLCENLSKQGIDIEHQFIISKGDGSWYYYDIRAGNKIIEFNGDYWHCNPQRYEPSYYNQRAHLTALEIWKKDEIKQQFAIDNGYEILVVWEHKYKANKEQVIQECINFLMK